MLSRIPGWFRGALLVCVLGVVTQPAWATLPTPSQPILVVQNSASADPYQNFVPELLTTEGLNGFQVAQLPELTADFLSNYDVVILPHLTLTSAQATLFQNYVTAGGTLVGFRPDLQLANVFGVSSLGTTLGESWLKIDTGTPYGAALDGQVMKFHGTADLYSLNGASALATLYSSQSTPTASPAASIYTFGSGSGKAILFSFDLTQSNVLMRQGNPAWAGYPNNHDGFNTMRPPQMFMDQGTGQFWNDLGDGALNDVPQADIQLRLFSNALVLSNAINRPLPRFWYFPNQNRALLLMTGDHHGDSVTNSIDEINTVASFGGKFSEFLWYPFGAISNTQVNTWVTAGHAMGIHFDDTGEVDASGVGGSAASWNGMQAVISNARTSFAATYPTAPTPITTRNHFLIWVSRNAAGNPDQTAQAKLFQNAGIEFDTSYAAFPHRWGYMTGSGLPMKFLDTATGAVIPVFEQATQYEDDIQLGTYDYALNWNLATAQSHYQQSLSDSLTKYNTVVTMLFHPDAWTSYSGYAQTVLQYAQSRSIPMYTTDSWLQFWKGRAATTVSKPSFTSNTLTFTATGSPAGLTLLVPYASGSNKVVSTFKVDTVTQSFTVAQYQGVMYAGVVLTAGTHNVSVSYTPAGRILGQITPSAAAASSTVQVQGGSISQNVTVAADGTYVAGPLPAGTYTVTPVSLVYAFSPSSRSVTLGTVDVTGVDFTATGNLTGQTLFTTQTPELINFTDGVNLEQGTVFTSDIAGQITGVRFWKDSNDTGTHIGKIWSTSGQLLTSVVFSNETASGWQQQALAAPLPIASSIAYIVSVNTANTFYVATSNGLATQVVNGHLRSVVGNNGVYGPVGQFPTNTFQNLNYFRDVYFVATEDTSIASVSLNPTAVSGGNTSTGTVTLTGPAPTGGAMVTLLSDSAAATVPPSVTVPAGEIAANFAVATTGVVTVTSVTVSANFNATVTTTLTINPAALLSLGLNPTSLVGGTTSVGTVTLTGPAPAGGATVALSSDNVAASVPPSVTVAGGATTATFTINTGAVATSTLVSISANYLGTATATLTINTAALTSLSLNPTTVAGGSASVATLTLNGQAPAGGAIVTLSSDNPVVPGIEGILSLSGLPQGGSLDWGNLGPEFSTIDSGTITPVTGLAGVNATISTATGLPMMTVTNCAFGGDCGWYGNFASGANLLWVSGIYDGFSSTWTANGPLTVRFDSPQRGIGFQVMADESGAFTATLCAYNSADTLLGCVPFNGNGTTTADGSAVFMGLYDDAQEIARVTIDNNGPLYPHDFAISQMFVTNSRRQQVPTTVTVPAGATTTTFPVNTSAVTVTTTVNISGTYMATQSAILTIAPSVLSTVTLTPSTVTGGTSLVGTVALTGAAPAGGASVTLSADNPVSTGVQTITATTGLPQDGSVVWTDLGPNQTSVPSGTVVPIAGLAGVTVTVATANGNNSKVVTNCPVLGRNCGFYGNFAPATPLLWTSGSYDPTGTIWTGNGPLTLTLSAPQRGIGFGIMSDEAGPFSGTICAYNAANTLLGCVPFSGTSAPFAGGTNGYAPFVGIYDDTPEISRVTIDANGVLYPHDFAISQLVVAASRRMVPPSIKVQAGATTATFPVNTDTVNTATTVTITGNYLGAHSGILIINPPAFSSLSVSPSSVLGGTSASGTVTLASPAPGGGAVITLSSDNAAAIVPASVTVPAGTLTASFTITTSGVATAASATISATYAGVTKTAPLTVTATALSSVSMSPASLLGGASSTGTVTLTGPAPTGGAVVTLTDDSASATTPASVTVAAGATSATFTVTTTAVGAVATVTITGTYNGPKTGTLTINPPQLSSVAMSPSSVNGGTSSTGTVTLTSAAPSGGTAVTLSDNSASATTPASVTVAAGATTATFNVTTVAVGTNATVTISATLSGTTQTASLTINAPVLSNLTMSPTSVNGGSSSTGTATLSSAAPTGGAVVTLSDDSSSSTTPASVTVAAGATTATFTVTTSAVATAATVTITGNFNGTRTATLTINPPTLTNLTLSPTSLIGGNGSTGTVTLGSVAPAGGAAVALSSNNAAAVVPASVTVAQGATTATFSITTSAVSAATPVTITGTYTATRTATLTVNPATLTSVAMSPTAVTGGTSSTGTVTLTGIAPAGGATVTLSDNNANATTPASVTVAAGSNTATFTVTTIPVSPASTATITAVYSGVTRTATLTINPPTLVSVTMNPATVYGGTSSTGTVTLDSPALGAGAVVTLSDNGSSTTTPANVTVPAGATTANFTVTSSPVVNATTVTITATLNGVAKTATLTLNPPQVASITLNPTTVIGGLQNSTATITFTAPVTGSTAQRRADLSSSNTAAATVPSTVTVPSGATTVTFTVTSRLVLATATSSISATMNGGAQSATLTVNP